MIARLLCFMLACAWAAWAVAAPGEAQIMTLEASGGFDVETKPESAPDDPVARLGLAKHYHGELDATGIGTMLAMGNPAGGNAGYVAMERVTGTLAGKSGSFALQHGGTMDGGKLALRIAIVPGSGTGDLAGIAGEMSITMADGKHGYVLRYTLTAAP